MVKTEIRLIILFAAKDGEALYSQQKQDQELTGLDLIDRVPDELWMEVHDIVKRQGSRPSPWKRNAKKQNGCLGRPYKYLRKEEKQKAKEKRKDISV